MNQVAATAVPRAHRVLFVDFQRELRYRRAQRIHRSTVVAAIENAA
jgi:hypothetical protein